MQDKFNIKITLSPGRLLFALLFFPVLAFAQMSSTNFQINSDVVGSFGGESDSSNFNLKDTGGEIGTGHSESDSFSLEAGFWQNDLYSIGISCDLAVNMNSIVGTGQSLVDGNNKTLCNVATDNPIGYKLEWQAAAATMENANADTIGAYSPAVADTPEAWSIANNTSEWGAKLGKDSTTYDSTKWGDFDTYAGGKWLNVSSGSGYQVIQKNSATDISGDNEYVVFGAEVGSNKMQPTGSYSVDVTITATTL